MHPLLRLRISNRLAAFVIAAIGIITFGSGLGNQFVGDDFSQLVNNAPVHSVANIPNFFTGSTFYQGVGQSQLAGVYYRPLMTATYALLYRLIGLQAYGYHLVQMLLYIAGVWLLFLLFRQFFARSLALALAVIFLVHPMNSQSVYSIADLQEPLYFAFGLLALWILMRTRGRSPVFIILSAFCLLLSMFAKETGLLFGAMALVYAAMFDRRRLPPVAGWSALALALYLACKIPAVGLVTNPGNAPIDRLSLAGRLLSVPATWVFYLGKFVFPWHIAHAYYWVVRSPSLGQFWLPLGLILAFAGLIIVAGRAVHRRSGRGFRVFVFFSIWLFLGLLFHSQIGPLDLTIALPWFMFPMAGLLGLIGTIIQTFILPLPRRWLIAVPVVLIVMLVVRSAVRGPDWSGTYTLAARDLSISAEDYPSANLLGFRAAHLGQFAVARADALRSIAVLPTADNLDTLGVADAGLGQYAQAAAAYDRSAGVVATAPTLEHQAQLTAVYGDPSANLALLRRSAVTFPHDGPIWFYLAVAEARAGNPAAARDAAARARHYGGPNPDVTAAILAGRPFTLTVNSRPQ